MEDLVIRTKYVGFMIDMMEFVKSFCMEDARVMRINSDPGMNAKLSAGTHKIYANCKLIALLIFLI
jgi:hypothetical protein